MEDGQDLERKEGRKKERKKEESNNNFNNFMRFVTQRALI
jgi:hypothetical protein